MFFEKKEFLMGESWNDKKSTFIIRGMGFYEDKKGMVVYADIHNALLGSPIDSSCWKQCSINFYLCVIL